MYSLADLPQLLSHSMARFYEYAPALTVLIALNRTAYCVEHIVSVVARKREAVALTVAAVLLSYRADRPSHGLSAQSRSAELSSAKVRTARSLTA